MEGRLKELDEKGERGRERYQDGNDWNTEKEIEEMEIGR